MVMLMALPRPLGTLDSKCGSLEARTGGHLVVSKGFFPRALNIRCRPQEIRRFVNTHRLIVGEVTILTEGGRSVKLNKKTITNTRIMDEQSCDNGIVVISHGVC